MTKRGPFVFVVNPRSAAGATLRRFERVREQFVAELGDVEVRLTERPRHATELARRAIVDGARAVIAVGGDGTNNEVVNGFFEADGSRLAGDCAFGVVTSGTGGDFRRTFGWGTDPLDDLARLRRFETRLIDVGRVTCATPAGASRSDHFVNVAGFGIDGVVVDVVNRSSKALGAKASFLLGSARVMATYRPQRVAVRIDDGKPQLDAITFVAIANGRFFGGGMMVAPDADPSDGLFDVVTVVGGGLSFWVRHGLKIYDGGHVTLPECRVVRCRKLVAEPALSEGPVLIDLDGEQPGCLPATFEIVPQALPLLV